MNKDQAVFFLTGILLGLVLGYVFAYQIHRPDPVEQAHAAAAGQPRAPGPDNDAMMEQVAQHLGHLKQRLESDPNDLEALVGLGNLFYDAAKYPDAIEYYSRAVKLSPDDPDIISDLGVSYRRNGNPNRAIELFRQATEAVPNHWQSWLNISIVAMQDLNDLAQAEEAISRVEQIQPDVPHLQELRDLLKHLKQTGGTQSAGAQPG